jgi:pantoate--beta-alanine ligase
LGYPIKIIIAPTVREEDGLAMSSRNRYFDEIGRWEAVCLFYALRTAQEMVLARIVDTKLITREMRAVIRATCPSAEIDYIAFTEFESLEPVKKVTRNTICSLAVRLYGVRLIDNMKLM